MLDSPQDNKLSTSARNEAEPGTSEQLMTRSEVARELRLTERYVDKLIADGAIASFKLGDGRPGRRLVRRSALDRFLAERERAS